MSSIRKGTGHNLLEVIIATFIFCVVIILFIGVWAQYHAALSNARNHLAASALGRQCLEQHVANGFAACSPANSDPAPVSIISLTRIKGRQINQEFKYQFTAIDNAAQNFRHLIVVVTWTDGSGDKKLTYDTFLYRTQ